MAVDPHRLPAEKALQPIISAYGSAQREIVARVKEALRSGDLRTAGQGRRRLASILATLDQLGQETDPEARRIVADAYQQGGALVGAETGFSVETAFGGVSTEAVQALQDSVVERLGVARTTVGRQVTDIFAREQRRASVRALLGADASPRTAAKGLRQALEREGRTGFVDRAGRRWALQDYAEMATRTVTREAVIAGAVDRMAAHGIEKARILVSESACAICQPHKDQIIELGGAAAIPPFHPRCTCALAPVAERIEAFAA